jgi:hypothetical protein
VETPDRRPGRLPDIRSGETNIRFLLTIAFPSGAPYQLILRCEQDGEIYASIKSAVRTS